MTDYAVEFYGPFPIPAGAKQWLADQKIFHHAESLEDHRGRRGVGRDLPGSL